jgi:phage gp45-like
MGCCCGHSKLAVTEDPALSAHIMVGKSAVYHRHGSKMLSKHGELIVKNQEIFHLGRKICCYKRLKTSWPVSELKQITVMNQESLTVSGSKSAKVLSLNPGVKMIFQDSEGNCQTLVVSMPLTSVENAQRFSNLLHHCVDSANESNS